MKTYPLPRVIFEREENNNDLSVQYAAEGHYQIIGAIQNIRGVRNIVYVTMWPKSRYLEAEFTSLRKARLWARKMVIKHQGL